MAKKSSKSKTSARHVAPISLKKNAIASSPPLNPLMAQFLMDQKVMEKEQKELTEGDKVLLGAEFRKINEKLYTSDADDNYDWIQKNPVYFDRYHAGYRSQVESWSVNPLDLIIERLKHTIEKQKGKELSKRGKKNSGGPKTLKIVDMGCGEANLSLAMESDEIKVTSYDLHSPNSRVTIGNIKSLPDPDKSFDFGVCCLALMGNDWPLILLESNRILKDKGTFFLAETTSRITDIDKFMKNLRSLGWGIEEVTEPSKFFVLFRLRKNQHISRFSAAGQKESGGDMKKIASMPTKMLKPCLYKKR